MGPHNPKVDGHHPKLDQSIMKFFLSSIFTLITNASGQRINIAKFGIFFSYDVDENKKRKIANILNMPICSSPGKYLGLPGDWQRSKCQALSLLKERIWRKIQGWNEKMLSLAGKGTLIKAFIQAYPPM